MDDILDVSWEEVVPGMSIRWVTPTFVKHGIVVVRKGNALKAKFAGNPGITVIPDAKWYFDMVSKGNAIVVVADKRNIDAIQSILEVPDSDDNWLTPPQAALILGTDAKAIRRMIRAGKLSAIKQNGTWLIDRSKMKGAE